MEGQMIRNLFLVFSISAICVMIYALIRVISLNKRYRAEQWVPHGGSFQY